MMMMNSAQPCRIDSLEITESLFEALPYLVLHCKTGYLWIDQICINQEDTKERNSQVSIMGDIYSHCCMVLVWLGLPTEDTALLEDLVECLSPDPQAYTIMQLFEKTNIWNPAFEESMMLDWLIVKTVEDVQPDLVSELKSVHKWLSLDHPTCTEGEDIIKVMKKLAKTIKNMLLNLIRRPWFNRIWILQEVILSPHVMFLTGNMTWSEFQLNHIMAIASNTFRKSPLLRCAEFDPFWGTGGFRTLSCVQDIMWKKQFGLDLHDTLKMFDANDARGRLKASDARDFIYGILGICDEASVAHFDVDYSWPAEQVFTYATQFIIHQRQDLQILTLCGGIEQSKEVVGAVLKLPSWVPDFTRHQDVQVDRRLGGIRPHMDSLGVCSYKHRARPPAASGNKLYVRGKTIGRVGASFAQECYHHGLLDYAAALFGAERCSSYSCMDSACLWCKSTLPEDHKHVKIVKAGLRWAGYRGGALWPPTYGKTSQSCAEDLIDLYLGHLRQNCPESQQLREFAKDDDFEPILFWDTSYRDSRKCEHGNAVFKRMDPVCPPDCEWGQVRAWSLGTQALKRVEPKAILLSTDDEIILTRGNGEVGDNICILHGCRWPVLLRETDTGEYQFVGGCFIEGGIEEDAGRVTWKEEEADEFILV